MKNFMKNFVAILCLMVLVLTVLFFSCVPAGKTMWNNCFFEGQKADNATNCITQKRVEDTARSILTTYEFDKMIYEQYIDSEDSIEKSIANQALTRANHTADLYNNYILINSFVWEGNIPEEFQLELPYLS